MCGLGVYDTSVCAACVHSTLYVLSVCDVVCEWCVYVVGVYVSVCLLCVSLVVPRLPNPSSNADTCPEGMQVGNQHFLKALREILMPSEG